MLDNGKLRFRRWGEEPATATTYIWAFAWTMLLATLIVHAFNHFVFTQ